MLNSRAFFTFRTLVLAFATIFASLAAGDPLSAQGKQGYNVVRLAVPGAATTEANGLNDSGNVAGTAYDAGGSSYGFHYDRAAGTYTSLGVDVTAKGMNNDDAIVGEDDILGVGLYWSSPTATPKPLPPLAGHTHSRGYAINSAGIIVGASYIPEESPQTPGFRAIVVWRVNAAGAVSDPVPLPYPAGDLRGGPSDLTEQIGGETVVIGSTGDETTFPKNAVAWSVTVDAQGKPVLLAGPTVLSDAYAAANGINASAAVVGEAVFTGSSSWPFLKVAGGQVTALAGLAKATFGGAIDINDNGQIVGTLGYVSRGNFIYRAVLWTSPTTAIDLNSLVTLGRTEKLTWAGRINSRGDILASINGNTPCLLIAK